VGYVGVVGKQEGLDLLLEAVAYMRDELRRDDVHFVIVGDATELAALRRLSRQLSPDDCVEFTGRLPDAALWEIMSTADVCVNPDRANEMNDKSTMNRILEYMALGKPIVQFDLTEGRFSAGESSLYARPNDTADFAVKVSELLDDPERCATVGAIGRSRIDAGLAWHHQIPRLLEGYETAMKRGGAHAKSLNRQSG
jgi:glycosyltransferase involved in cell wall biosynthesis